MLPVKKILGLILAVIITFKSIVNAQGMQDIERNKKNVTTFYELLINKKDFNAAEKYLGNKYIQHNPMAKDGKEGLKEFIGYLKTSSPNFKADIKQVFAEKEYVILHVHSTNGKDDRGLAIIDIFRLDAKGMIVEHWDVIQPVPENIAHSNGMF